MIDNIQKAIDSHFPTDDLDYWVDTDGGSFRLINIDKILWRFTIDSRDGNIWVKTPGIPRARYERLCGIDIEPRDILKAFQERLKKSKNTCYEV